MTAFFSRARVRRAHRQSRTARVGIVGLGYAGLPLAMAFAEAGFDVVGIDLNRERVQAIGDHRSYLVDVPAERYDGVDGKLEATTDYSAVSSLDALTICVPTPLSKTRTPDLSYVVSAAESVAEQLSPGQLVILQSTTYPGTTEQVIRPILERAGAVVGDDVFLGYAPERVDPGNRGLGRPHDAEARRAASATSACAARSCSTRRSSTRSCPSPARWWPRRRSCTRTPSAP